MGGMAAVASRSDSGAEDSHERHAFAFESVIDGICAMPWERLSGDDILCVAKAYYFFSIQFRENLEIACGLRPRDANLRSLRQGECDTDNLSPYPGVTAPGERLDHDEFMKRLLAMQPLDADSFIGNLGRAYLGRMRDMAPMARATSIASYEDGGLSRVFAAMLRAPGWGGAGRGPSPFFFQHTPPFTPDNKGGQGGPPRRLPPATSLPLRAAPTRGGGGGGGWWGGRRRAHDPQGAGTLEKIF